MKAEEIPDIIRTVRAALSEGDAAPAQSPSADTPKMTKAQIAKSITPDGLKSFVDGRMYKTLKRHFARNGHDMRSYREAYGLPNDYPSVAPSYSAARSEMAKKPGLGAQSRNRTQAEAPAAATAPAGRGRKKAEAPAA